MRLKKNEQGLRALWNNNKISNINFIGIPEREEKECGDERVFR